MKECHEKKWAGHNGWQRRYALLKEGDYWPSLRDEVMQFTKTCLVCQLNMKRRTKVSGSMWTLTCALKAVGECVPLLLVESLRPSPFSRVTSSLSFLTSLEPLSLLVVSLRIKSKTLRSGVLSIFFDFINELLSLSVEPLSELLLRIQTGEQASREAARVWRERG